jgi:hypothetical protein
VLKMLRSLTGPSAEGQRGGAMINGAYQRIEDLLGSGGRCEFCVRGRAHMRKKRLMPLVSWICGLKKLGVAVESTSK